MSDQAPVLRLVDRPSAGGRRTVAVTWQPARRTARETSVEVDLTIDPGVAEKVRWYLEDYGEFPAEPAPAIAAETEEIAGRAGPGRCSRPCSARDAARDLWAEARLDGLRASCGWRSTPTPADVPGLPWELLRDPATDRPLVVAAGAVRAHASPGRRLRRALPAAATAARLRVLLVICRPGRPGRRAVPVGGVPAGPGRRRPARGLDLDVLRPPTFARLSAGAARRPGQRAGRTTWCTSMGTAPTSTRSRPITTDGNGAGRRVA